MKKISLQQLLEMDPNLLKGQVICFPTDTVYGVGVMVDCFSQTLNVGLNRIYEFKKRDNNKALPVLISHVASLSDFVSEVDEISSKLIKLWPAALTICFPKNKKVPSWFSRGSENIAIRMPQSDIALKLIEHLGPMATTSINISGSDPLNDLKTIEQFFNDAIDYMITDEALFSEVSSTVVMVQKQKIVILRQGNLEINV